MNPFRRVLLAHPGTQHARHIARELARHGLLGEFWTGLAFAEHGFAAGLVTRFRWLPRVKSLGNRLVPGIPAARLRRVPWNEIRALVRLSRGGDVLRILHERNARFQDSIPDAALRASDAVIAFDTSAWRLAARARALSRPLYLDRSIAHPAAFARIEAGLRHRYPAWCPTVEPRPDFLVAAEAEEHQLAHRIVVGSTFARDTLIAEGITPGKISVNPYGVEWRQFAEAAWANEPAAPRARPLRFLFAGSVMVRKGVPVLLDAWRALAPREAELWIAGGIGARERPLLPSLPGLHFLGQVPHSKMPRLYARSDVFVLPSLFEGYGLVLLEALASGLPIIATRNTGAPDFLADPLLGELVEVASVDSLVAAMQRYLDHRPDRSRVQAAAAPLAARFSWEAYGDRWAGLLDPNAE